MVSWFLFLKVGGEEEVMNAFLICLVHSTAGSLEVEEAEVDWPLTFQPFAYLN